MRKSLLVLAFILASAARASAAFTPPLFYGFGPITTPGFVTQYESGNLCIAGSSNTAGTCSILLDRGGGVNASSGSFTNGITASSGTFTATGLTQYSLTVSSGILLGGTNTPLTFSDGTKQFSAAATGTVSAAGNNTLSGNNTFSGNNNFTTGTNTHNGTESFFTPIRDSSGTVEGDATAGTGLNQGGMVWAKSIDGVTQSSGCAVVINVGNGNNATSNFLTFTSTVTGSSSPFIGVLMTNSCAPSTICQVAVHGLYRAQVASGGTVTNKLTTDTTRCRFVTSASYSIQFSGMLMAVDATNWGTVFLNGP